MKNVLDQMFPSVSNIVTVATSSPTSISTRSKTTVFRDRPLQQTCCTHVFQALDLLIDSVNQSHRDQQEVLIGMLPRLPRSSLNNKRRNPKVDRLLTLLS